MAEGSKNLKDDFFYSFLKENNIKCYITTPKAFYKKAFIESFNPDKTVTIKFQEENKQQQTTLSVKDIVKIECNEKYKEAFDKLKSKDKFSETFSNKKIYLYTHSEGILKGFLESSLLYQIIVFQRNITAYYKIYLDGYSLFDPYPFIEEDKEAIESVNFNWRQSYKELASTILESFEEKDKAEFTFYLSSSRAVTGNVEKKAIETKHLYFIPVLKKDKLGKLYRINIYKHAIVDFK